MTSSLQVDVEASGFLEFYSAGAKATSANILHNYVE